MVAERLRDDGGEVIGTNGFLCRRDVPTRGASTPTRRSTSSHGGRRQPTSRCACLPNSSWPIFGHSTTTTPCPHAHCLTNYCNGPTTASGGDMTAVVIVSPLRASDS